MLAALWRDAGLPDAALDDIALTGAEPVLPSSFAVGTAAQATIAAAALAAAEIWRLRTGRRQRVSVDMRRATIEFRSEHYLSVDGLAPDKIWDDISGLYRCGDGRWVRLHTVLPHHRSGLIKLLGCAEDRASVQLALDKWQAEALETAAADAGLVVSASRSIAEWDSHPQGRAVAKLPLFAIEKIGDAPALKLGAAQRPLAGLRVLDLTRIIAGPVCGRTLAVHGADVLLITASHLPSIRSLVIDTGRGKLSAAVDLRADSGRETLAALLRDADIFVQGYRPGAVAGRGFSPQQAASIRPGIIYVSLSAYGQEGPWAGRRGFDSLVQNASGLNDEEACAFGAREPQAKPSRCRRKLSTTPPAICSPSPRWRRSSAAWKRAAPGTCGCRSRKPATGCVSSAVSTAWRAPIPVWTMSAIAWKRPRPASDGSPRFVMRLTCRKPNRTGRGRACRSAPTPPHGRANT